MKKAGRSLLTGLTRAETEGRDPFTGMTEEEIRQLKESRKRKKGESLMKWAQRLQRGVGELP